MQSKTVVPDDESTAMRISSKAPYIRTVLFDEGFDILRCHSVSPSTCTDQAPTQHAQPLQRLGSYRMHLV